MMKMSYLCIMTFWFCLTESSKLSKKHVHNSVFPLPDEQVYNITSWVRQLHLQQCVLVEIGEKYCGVFIEYRSLAQQKNTEIQEYFLGLCDTYTLRKWNFCPPALERERPADCIFQENTELSDNPTRVHRRLCEVTNLAFSAELCNCSGLLAGQKLHKVAGFPTCFLTPLPESVCSPRNVCGIASCNASTLGRQVHIVQCNPKCIGGQPFCETNGFQTSEASEINSYWSDWHELTCNSESQNCTEEFFSSEAVCINRNTGMGAIDCLGPGTNCCPPNSENCRCHIFVEDGVLRLFRQGKVAQSAVEDTERVSFYENSFLGRRRHNRNIPSPKLLLRKNFDQHGTFEEDYEDDKENIEDDNEEDIVLEEDENHKTYVTTTEAAERSEYRQDQHFSEVEPQKYALEEMAKDVTTESRAYIRFRSCILSYNFLNLIVVCLLFI